MKMLRLLRLLRAADLVCYGAAFFHLPDQKLYRTQRYTYETNDHISSMDWLNLNNLHKPSGTFESFLVYLGGPVVCP